MSSPVLSVIIANYNGEPWLAPCLTSIMSQTKGVESEVIVVDNNSQDDSVALVEREFPSVRVVARTRNAGFAQANNEGIALAQGHYILLLNNDTVFLSGLETMLAFLDQHPQCAAVGPRMLDGHGRLRASWGYFPLLSRLTATMLFLDRVPVLGRRFRPLLVRPGRSQFSDAARPVDWASGACLLLRREVVTEVGSLDPAYFMYGEDVEWCYRMWQSGYEVWILPEAQLIHHGAGGGEWRNWKGPLATEHTYRHFLHFSSKHLPAWQMLPLRLSLTVGASLRLLGALVLCLNRCQSNRAEARSMSGTYAKVLHRVIGLGRA